MCCRAFPKTPEVPTWVSAAAFFVLINMINLTNVKVFGEAELWFAIIKIERFRR